MICNTCCSRPKPLFSSIAPAILVLCSSHSSLGVFPYWPAVSSVFSALEVLYRLVLCFQEQIWYYEYNKITTARTFTRSSSVFAYLEISNFSSPRFLKRGRRTWGVCPVPWSVLALEHLSGMKPFTRLVWLLFLFRACLPANSFSVWILWAIAVKLRNRTKCF